MGSEQLKKALAAAEKKSERLAMARAALPAGSSRARVTSANAKWARAAEYRDLLRKQADDAEGK